MFKRKAPRITKEQMLKEQAEAQKRNDDIWRKATARIAVDIRKGYQKEGR